ncbi:oligopeptide transporter, putative [Ricinus communis]|uniref:Oligopeptide transporter, putative n=1 Tax=Ricinus communis TaxID=3988 RepID=B9SKQ0_RICCO|nr:oligopeptide transporter, putative [Ricinus communis]
MTYSGIASNLVLYLTRKLHEGTVASSNNVTNFRCIRCRCSSWPILDFYHCFCNLSHGNDSVNLSSFRPPSCGPNIKEENCDLKASALQKGIFYGALYIIAAGTGGTKPNISTMGADQFDDFEPKERTQKLSFFNWWMFSIFIGTLFSYTFLVYIQDNVGWALCYALPTIGLAVSIAIFFAGTPFYRHKLLAGSPFTRIVQVFIAAFRKQHVPLPKDHKELHELSPEEFFDKAAVKTDSTSPWMLYPVTQVEETKQMMKMLPVLVVTFIPSTMLAQVHTLFIKQGTTLDRRMGPHFEIPPACLSAFMTIFMLISLVLYDRYFVLAVRRYTKNPRGITLLQRMGIGFILHVIIMAAACLAERKRLNAAKEHNIVEKDAIVPLSTFILLPQFALMGVADTFVEVAKLEFFYDQAPDGMKSLGTSYFTSSVGIGNFLSSFLLKTVADITKTHGHKGWILDNLNISRLDYYYAFLTILTFINLSAFLIVAKYFDYNKDVDAKKELQEAIEASPDKLHTEDT